MNSPFPGVIAWPVHFATLVVILVRYRIFRPTLSNLCLNRCLITLLITQLLRERAVQDWVARVAKIPHATTWQLSMYAMTVAAGQCLSLIDMLGGASDDVVRRRQLAYRALVFSCIVVMVLCGARARDLNTLVETAGGFAGIIFWLANCVTPSVAGYRLLRISRRELGSGEATRGERAITTLAMLVGVVVVVSVTDVFFLAIIDYLGVTSSTGLRVYLDARCFFVISSATVFVAFYSCARAMWRASRFSVAGRQQSRLYRLWGSVTAAFPELSLWPELLRDPANPASLRLHRMTVEIRDGIIRARPYFNAISPHDRDLFTSTHKVPKDAQDSAMLALGLAKALHLKASGGQMLNASPSSPRSSARNLDEEIRELIAVADWWPDAVRWVTESGRRAVTELVLNPRQQP